MSEPLNLCIAGSRSIVATALIGTLIRQFEIPVKRVIEGGARGVDESARSFAYLSDIPYQTFKADWDRLGKSAGLVRNAEMAEAADALLLIWDGESRGSANMKQQMLALGKPVYECVLRTHNTLVEGRAGEERGDAPPIR